MVSQVYKQKRSLNANLSSLLVEVMVSDGRVRDVRRPRPRLRKRVNGEAAEEVLAQSHPFECWWWLRNKNGSSSLDFINFVGRRNNNLTKKTFF